MKHPDEGTLALYAGGDLRPLSMWRTRRHLVSCGTCRDTVTAYAELREVLPELAEIPEVPWNRLAAEMRANIRLGLEAGECVQPITRQESWNDTTWFKGMRAAVAVGGVVAMVVTGLMLERPAPVAVAVQEAPLVQATENGIQVRSGAAAFRLMNAGARSVTYSAGADGSMGARYVDPETGHVTINNVYVE